MEDKNQKHKVELSTILKEGISAFKRNHVLHPVQEKAVNDMIKCRSSELGGHIKLCHNCGFAKQAYNSCRNRHCPKCQYIKQEQWVDKLAHNLLPCKYYHVVFTIPKQLHSFLYLNQKHGYSLLFKASTQALMKAAINPDFLGVQTGALAVLHTWTQTLCYHPHIHMLVPAGGLSEDEMEWVKSNKKFFLPQKVLSRIFRGVLVRLFNESVDKGIAKLPESINSFNDLKAELYQKDWNIYIKKPFRGVTSVVKYLGRYTHRVAISNGRLVKVSENEVSFWYKDNKDKGKTKIMALNNQEFIRRYLQHILPANFYKIRYIGILANTNIKTKKERCLSLLDKQDELPQLEGLNAMEVIGIIRKIDPLICPKCKNGKLCLIPYEAG